ncbi:MAG: hypothetical protein II234_04300, partial [Clostridia bacterium]|nr:hypothetical protein [Clostridia bacterium]
MERKKKEEVKIRAFKGFEHDWTCRGFKYEIGKTYEQEGDIEVCNNGFHACEEPLRVLQYYSACDHKGNLRKFAEVEQSGEIAKDNDKTASSKINIKAELSIFDLAKLQVEYIKERCNDIKETSGNRSSAVNSGYGSSAVNSGYRSAAVNSGDGSSAVNSGDWSSAVNSGDWSSAVNSGDRSAAVNSGYGSSAVNSGDGSSAVNSG